MAPPLGYHVRAKARVRHQDTRGSTQGPSSISFQPRTPGLRASPQQPCRKRGSQDTLSVSALRFPGDVQSADRLKEAVSQAGWIPTHHPPWTGLSTTHALGSACTAQPGQPQLCTGSPARPFLPSSMACILHSVTDRLSDGGGEALPVLSAEGLTPADMPLRQAGHLKIGLASLEAQRTRDREARSNSGTCLGARGSGRHTGHVRGTRLQK